MACRPDLVASPSRNFLWLASPRRRWRRPTWRAADVQPPPAQPAARRRRDLLLLAATGGLIADLAGAFAGAGPQKNVLGAAPYAAIGFVEAHGLAFIIGVLLWRAEPQRSWHLIAAAVMCCWGPRTWSPGSSSSPPACWRWAGDDGAALAVRCPAARRRSVYI
jgi:hypothetical protein